VNKVRHLLHHRLRLTCRPARTNNYFKFLRGPETDIVI
jgi:hypothetical protein